MACIDEFSKQIKKPTTLIIDNASTHTSNEFTENIKRWNETDISGYLILGSNSEFVFLNEEEKLEVGFAAVFNLIEESGQTMLLGSEPLTIIDLWKALRQISRLKGPRSREKKFSILRSLVQRMSDLERHWFLKQIIGEMQHGVNEGLLLEAIAELTSSSLEEIQRAFMLLGKIGDLVNLAVTKGREGIRAVRLEVFRPIRPMLAEMYHDVSRLLKESDEPLALEYKFDGARVQIHVKDGVVKIFSRRLIYPR